MSHRSLLPILSVSLASLTLLCLSGCSDGATASSTEEPASTGIAHQQFTDAVHAVMMADRTVYASKVVTRLKKQDASVTPSEYWEDEDHTIPLPAQMFRMGAEIVTNNSEAGFTYGLKSKWPLNEQNKPSTEFETEALDFLAENPGKNFYGEETLGEQNYFVAAYADTAVAEACWSCHNDHSNRKDSYPEFKKGDVMGGVVVRVPIE